MSSGEFSFDPAAPAETMEGTNDSGGDSTVHSSPDTGSFSQVTSTNRSQSINPGYRILILINIIDTFFIDIDLVLFY